MNEAADTLMQCIVCMAMKPRRTGVGEHVIPLALGGSFTIDRVCLDCDNRLGASADAGLIELSAVEQRRADLGLAGHAGVVPDPPTERFLGPLTHTDDPRHRVLLRRDRKTGAIVPATVTRIEFDVQDVGGGLLIQPSGVYIDPADSNRVEDLARRALRRAGVKNEKTVCDVAKQFAESLETVESAGLFAGQQRMRIGGHRDGILKIAYELAWYWLGDSWLNDSVARRMRAVLNGQEPDSPILGKLFDDPSAGVIVAQGDQRAVHVAYVYEHDKNLLLFIRLFDLLTAAFQVTSDASTYVVPERNGIVMEVRERRYEEVHFGPIDPQTGVRLD